MIPWWAATSSSEIDSPQVQTDSIAKSRARWTHPECVLGASTVNRPLSVSCELLASPTRGSSADTPAAPVRADFMVLWSSVVATGGGGERSRFRNVGGLRYVSHVSQFVIVDLPTPSRHLRHYSWIGRLRQLDDIHLPYDLRPRSPLPSVPWSLHLHIRYPSPRRAFHWDFLTPLCPESKYTSHDRIVPRVTQFVMECKWIGTVCACPRWQFDNDPAAGGVMAFRFAYANLRQVCRVR
jgi:hypothetical protein